MKLRLVLPALALVALPAPAATGAVAAPQKFSVFGSCDNTKPRLGPTAYATGSRRGPRS